MAPTSITEHTEALIPVISVASPAMIPPINPPMSNHMEKYAASSLDTPSPKICRYVVVLRLRSFFFKIQRKTCHSTLSSKLYLPVSLIKVGSQYRNV